MRILITNDDGARAPGIKLLEEIARAMTDDVWIVAPEFDQSGVSHAISLHEPLRVHREGEKRYFVKGTPADCVILGVEHLLDAKPDLVLAGVNRGGNMADSIAYSGTVGAAMTALTVGVPAIALSQYFQGVDVKWECARAYAKPLIERLLEVKWPQSVVPNINFPHRDPGDIAGVTLCHPGHGFIDGVNVVERVDVRGLSYHWLQFRRSAEEVDDPACDISLLREGHITITPLRPDRHGEWNWSDMRAQFGDVLTVAPMPDLG
ncbi:5'/3'-nucleotidase SurE [Acuticoccus sp. I52.16.1]|uniref:5'/3'-nucleotidase SurE n=1 Tax=Acuticoccus sp. I52.16.1 TaxID=2928472 RepID=UPI001FD4C592|nr:5'/3'-nucleotidase SurE [Acuticoccus sp. I52.16.1]UOM34046.1 5'/3'-nucleotidase SurE [Acuticoccus sp. I52.16.1]